MALAVGGLVGAACLPPPSSSTRIIGVSEAGGRIGFSLRHRGGRFRAMVQQQMYQGASATYAKEMERLSAKESLLLAFKDSGGIDSLVSGKITDMQRIDVNERIVGLERLNPTPRPSTSPFLEGRWNFEWFSAGSPGLLAAKLLFERFPTTVANLVGLKMLLKDGYSKVTANMKFLNSIKGNFLLTTKLSLEGPIRMKEEYVEGIFETPTISEESIPEQLKGPLGQAANSLQQLPAPIKDAFANGLRIPLNNKRYFRLARCSDQIGWTSRANGRQYGRV